jgi:hypothetical protein
VALLCDRGDLSASLQVELLVGDMSTIVDINCGSWVGSPRGLRFVRLKPWRWWRTYGITEGPVRGRFKDNRDQYRTAQCSLDSGKHNSGSRSSGDRCISSFQESSCRKTQSAASVGSSSDA